MRLSQVFQVAVFRVGPLKTHRIKTSGRTIGSAKKSGRTGRRRLRLTERAWFYRLGQRPISPLVRGLAAYVGAIVVSSFCVWLLWDLWKADLRYPLVGMLGDVLHAQAVIFKGMTDNGWSLHNRWLGAPFGLDMRDFPLADLLVLGAAKFLSFFTKNHILIRNLIAVGSYPLVTVTSLHVMRRLGIRYTIALAGSLLFAFLTYHHMRIGPHILLGIGYFTVPFATLLGIELFDNKSVFIESNNDKKGAHRVGGRETWRVIAWCAVMGLTGAIYFPYFSCYVLMVAGVFASFHHRSLLPWVRCLCMQGVIGVALFALLSPTLLNDITQGHLSAIDRNPQDAELYGLKIVQMIIPGAGHRVAWWQRIGEFYNRVAPDVTENRMAYMGVLGVAGFLYLIFAILRGQERDSRLRTLSVLNTAVLLLGTIGGFSSVFAFLVSGKIRGYNRIGVYIAFFALLALALLAERAVEKWVRTARQRVAFGIALTCITGLGLYDQYALDVDYDILKKQYLEMDKWVSRIERSFPSNSSIFQYPYFPMPENGPIHHLSDYALMEPYLHSKAIRWSYGAAKGRRGDAWIAHVASLPVDQAIVTLVQAGFSGIYVARDGYGDHGAALEASLASLLGKPVLVSPKGDCSLYSLVNRAKILHAQLGEEKFQRRQADVLTPMYLAWRDGFYPPEQIGKSEHVWCQAKGRFVIENPSSRPKHVVLNADLRVARSPATVRLESDVLTREIHITQKTYHLSEGFEVPPGVHLVAVQTDSRSSKPDDMMRDLRLAFVGANLETLGQ